MFALTADQIFTGREVVEGYVLVENETVVDLTPTLPPEITGVREFKGATLLPGLIDAHTHVSVIPSHGRQLEQMKRAAELQLVAARSNLLSDLISGVTLMRVLGQEFGVDFQAREEVASGSTPGPDLLCAGIQLARPQGHGHVVTSVSSRDDMEAVIESNRNRGAEWVKVFATGGVSSVETGSDQSYFSPGELKWIVDFAHSLGMKVAAHALGGEGAHQAIEAGIDTIEHGIFLTDQSIRLALEKGTAIVGTFSIIFHPAGIQRGDAGVKAIQEKLEAAKKRSEATWRKIIAAGGRIALGTDSMHGCLAFDVARLVEWGASEKRALRAVTSEAAEICGVGDRCGFLRAGYQADVIAVRGNPLADIDCLRGPLMVMKKGRFVHA